MELLSIAKILAKNNIPTSIHYNFEKDQFYIDLDTRAKSELHLYEDGVLRGRYSYETNLNFEDEVSNLIKILCVEFSRALYGRDYYNQAWADLCEKNNVTLNISEYYRK